MVGVSGYAVNITQTDQGVNMGDHGQDVIRAVAPKPDETVQQLIERTLMTFSWDDSGPGTPAEDRYLTIRIAKAEGS